VASVVQSALTRSALSHPYNRFQSFAWFALIYNVFVVLIGAYVRASGSGAGCGSHWPLCNGQVIPHAPQIQTVIEFTHRITSGLSLLVVALLCIWAFRLFPARHRVRRLSIAAAVFLLAEALLGAGLVLFEFVAHNESVGRAFYLAAHLANTLLLLAALSLTAWFARPEDVRLRWREVPWLFYSALPVAVLVSVTGAIAALGDTLHPAASLATGFRQDFSATATLLVRLRIVHPFIAGLGGLLFAVIAVYALGVTSRPVMRRLAVLVLIATSLQLCAGVINLSLLAPIWMQIVHLLLADAVWISLVIFVAESARPSIAAKTVHAS
jgi:cytochrome c oxidase assembly protein subunit 15